MTIKATLATLAVGGLMMIAAPTASFAGGMKTSRADCALFSGMRESMSRLLTRMDRTERTARPARTASAKPMK